MEDLTDGYNISDPTDTIHYSRTVTSYVDDCNMLVNRRQNTTPTANAMALHTSAQQSLQTWVEIIRLLGGDISIEKNFYSIYPGWIEDRDGPHPMELTLTNATANITIEDTPIIWIMKDEGRALEIRQVFDLYVVQQFQRYYGISPTLHASIFTNLY